MREPDVVDVLTADHTRIERWFRDYERTPSAVERRRLITNIIIELVRHAEAEEMYVYPRARLVLPNGHTIVDREIAEHAEAERIMSRLDRMKPMDAGFDPLARELMRVVRGHVREEEKGWFPVLRRLMPLQDRRRLAELVEGAKVVAPTRPHPGAPNRPPLNVLVGVGTGVADRARDLLSGRRQR
ncbi:hemerythrin [Parafrankia colletiae]|uniref:Hemerythrin n=1 Tax=Parafrankia colletiae TaxID=573497 RepID=A0A1S1RKW5_9ACTN|nr:hemerythrin domain-containing protein [Parafrankia colletiae]MCK9899219.1 hemerythrin domain-containing protein [Frankia sp. Cpl3]OHV45902.1 hemerythrin [Parafrankia colletiae]